jgi:hypothetical protein
MYVAAAAAVVVGMVVVGMARPPRLTFRRMR